MEQSSHGQADGLLAATVLLAALLLAATFAENVRARRKRQACIPSHPSGLLAPIAFWPLLRPGCVVVGLGLILLISYQTILPRGGAVVSALLLAVAAVGAAVAVLLQMERRWSVGLAEMGLGLLTLAACVLATVVVPGGQRDIAWRYPIILNAVLVALAIMTVFWVWLAEVWRQQLPEDDGTPWTTAGRMVPVNRSFAKVTGFGGLAVALMMAAWPLLPGIPVDDDTLGRIAGGVAGHMLLLLASVRCGRWTRHSGFRYLSTLVAFSMIAFVAVRARLFTA